MFASKNFYSLFAVLVCAALLASCAPTPAPAPTAAPTAGDPPVAPTSTLPPPPTATILPSPTSTPTPLPSPTPTATLTPSPTLIPSPTPTQSPLLASAKKLDRQTAGALRQVAEWGLGAIRSQVALQGGKLILVTSEQGLFLYAAETLKLVQAFPKAGPARFSNDGRYMVYNDSARLAVYDLAETRLYQTLSIPAGMTTAAFSPDNQFLAVVHSSTEIDVVRLADLSVTPLSRARTSQNEPTTYQAAFSPDNTRLLTHENGGLVLWDIPEKKLAWYQKNVSKYIPQQPFSLDGQFFLAQDSKGTSLHDARFGTQLFSALGSPTLESFSADGKLFFLVNKGVVTIYRLNKEPGVVRVVVAEGPGGTYFSPDSSQLFAGNKVLTLADFSLKTLQNTPAPPVQISPDQALQLGHFSNLKGFAAGSKGELWVWGIQGKKVFRWETVSGELQTIELAGSKLMANLAYHPESQRFAACTERGLEVLDLKAGSRQLFPACVTSGVLAFSPDGTQIARASLTTIDILNSSDGSVVRKLIEHTVNINQLAFSADGKWLAAGTIKNMQNGYCQVSLWQLDPLRRVPGFRGKLIPGGVVGLAVTGDGEWLVGMTNMLRLWRTLDSEQMKYVDVYGASLALAPGASVAATGRGGLVQLWSVPEFDPLGSLSLPAGEILGLGFTPAETHLVTYDKDGVVRLFGAP